MKIQDEINEFRKNFNISLKNYIDKNIGNDQLDKAIKYSLTIGGKRIRPFIVKKISDLLKLSSKECIALSLSVELIHTYTLIHDDLPAMDNDDLRRGKPSTHIKFTEANAILAGNSIFSLAISILIKEISPKKNHLLIKIINLLCDISGINGLAKGQSLDIEMQNKKITLNKLLKINELKTSKLFEFCVLSPFILKNSSTTLINEAKLFATNLGLVFQITDDFLDIKNNQGAPYLYKLNNKSPKSICSQLIDECTTNSKFFGKNNSFFNEFLYYILDRKT